MNETELEIRLFYHRDLDLWSLHLNGDCHVGVPGHVAESLIEGALLSVEHGYHLAPRSQGPAVDNIVSSRRKDEGYAR